MASIVSEIEIFLERQGVRETKISSPSSPLDDWIIEFDYNMVTLLVPIPTHRGATIEDFKKAVEEEFDNVVKDSISMARQEMEFYQRMHSQGIKWK